MPMKKNTITLRLVAFALLSLTATTLSAQIYNTSSTLVIGSPTTPPVPNVISVFQNPTLRFENGPNFLRYDLAGSNPSICGYNQYVGICCTAYGPMFMNFTSSSIWQVLVDPVNPIIPPINPDLPVSAPLRATTYSYPRSAEASVTETQTITLPDAEAIAEVYPNLIRTDADGDRSLDFAATVMTLFQTVQQLQQCISLKKEELAKLRTLKENIELNKAQL